MRLYVLLTKKFIAARDYIWSVLAE